mgnify:CR=1 FL=1
MQQMLDGIQDTNQYKNTFLEKVFFYIYKLKINYLKNIRKWVMKIAAAHTEMTKSLRSF